MTAPLDWGRTRTELAAEARMYDDGVDQGTRDFLDRVSYARGKREAMDIGGLYWDGWEYGWSEAVRRAGL